VNTTSSPVEGYTYLWLFSIQWFVLGLKITKLHTIKRKDSPKPEESPKPLEDNNSRPTTPVQDKDEDIAAPLTPTTNLKMLVYKIIIKIIALEILLGVCNFSPDLNLIINKHF
jgi:hypothetical protein